MHDTSISNVTLFIFRTEKYIPVHLLQISH